MSKDVEGTGLTAHRVKSLADAQAMRVIRNACRAGFAHDNGEISEEAQRDWWASSKSSVVAYIYRAEGNAVGYGLLRLDEGYRWISSVAVLPEYAGNGYGGAITAHLIRQSPSGIVYAQARKDQPAACALHRAEDWAVTGEDQRLFYYRTRYDICDRPTREARAVTV